MKKRIFSKVLLTVTACMTMATAAAQAYPNKAIKWVVGYPAGGGSDMVARVLAEKLQKELGQPVVIENKPGATTLLAAQMVAGSPADGYTLFSPDNGTLINNPAMFKKLSYDPVADFDPVTMIVKIPMVLVAHPSFPAADINEFVTLVKNNPGKYTYASPGKGTPHHLAMELFKSRAGLEVPDAAYRGGAPATQDVLANQLPFMVLDISTAAQHIKAGKLKAYAVMQGSRLDSFPDVPAIAEAGFKDLDVYAWQGVVVPAGTPKTIIDTLNTGLIKAIEHPDTQTRLLAAGMETLTSTPEAYAEKIKTESALWQPFIKELNIQLD
ncbi:Bug family tripartite tricarboxylate transporter substrate binding protein [Advenella alkanexedens]|uniref:Bug family tripartite tricarboxylate transporter substrate binding protein n=1 Tax=Advenella alkanexedens TaxID=1481665 RepID=UPI00267735FE|nr:tripartite tricarboxylate transporter substrate binding protein [Advenella alkanexedens]WKU19698.1 tripartite tricarboxylate transporter substrate binding protein [Advenella alkanexedens]